jgi:hypothetical protein
LLFSFQQLKCFNVENKKQVLHYWANARILLNILLKKIKAILDEEMAVKMALHK